MENQEVNTAGKAPSGVSVKGSLAKKVGIFVLGLCICVMVGVGVGVLVNYLVELNTHTYPVAMHDDNLAELNDAVARTYMDEARLLYENAIEDAENDSERAKVRVEYGSYLLEYGHHDEGLAQFNLVDDSILGANYKMLLYAAYRDYYIAIGESELADEYNNRIGEVVSNSDFAAGGGA